MPEGYTSKRSKSTRPRRKTSLTEGERRLLQRQKDFDEGKLESAVGKLKFHRPGSTNRNK